MPDGPPPEPAVQRLRVRYAKRGRLRFSSHRDFQRALERAVRRAGVPVAFSAGFSPHPKISFANAAPTGAASEAEYLEISLRRRCDPALVREALDEALPAGLDVLEVVEAGPGSLADRLEASVWQVELPGVSAVDVVGPLAAFLAAPAVQVQRLTKNGLRSFDARAAVLDATLPDQTSADAVVQAGHGTEAVGLSCAILRLVVRHLTPAVRPDDVLAALRAVADFAPPSPPRVTRLAQGPLSHGNGAVADPLAADRNAAET